MYNTTNLLIIKLYTFYFIQNHINFFLFQTLKTLFSWCNFNNAVYALAKVQNLLPSNIKLTIYNSLFISYIEYGISCWGKTACPDMKKKITLQKRAVRLIDDSK